MKSFKKTFRRIEKKYILNEAQYTALMEYLQTIAKIDEAFAKVKSGEIVPASNFGGTLPDNFEGLE